MHETDACGNHMCFIKSCENVDLCTCDYCSLHTLNTCGITCAASHMCEVVARLCHNVWVLAFACGAPLWMYIAIWLYNNNALFDQ